MDFDKTQMIDGHLYHFGDLVDMPEFALLLESFFRATGIPNGVVDADGTLLSLAAGNNVCTMFHRANQRCAERCRDSNLLMMQGLDDGAVAGGLCHNGLMDYATPIIIEERLVATLFLGQVLHAPPDIAFFRAQAAKFAFDQDAYLASIQAVPVIEKARLEDVMAVMVGMAKMLAASGLARLRQNVLEREISTSVEQQIQLEDILNFSPVAIGWSEGNKRIEYINRQFTQLFGYTLDDLPSLQTWYQLAYPDVQYREAIVLPWQQAVEQAHKNNAPLPELEANITSKDGTVHRVVVRSAWVGQRRLLSYTDITERWMSEQRKQAHDAMLELIARGSSLPDILNAIVRQVEFEDKTSVCSVLLLDASGTHLQMGAAPRLPASYAQAVYNTEVPVGMGSSDTATVSGQRVIVEDIATHPDWKPYLQQAQEMGLRSCWSEPILDSHSKVLGTFSIYHAQPASPQREDIERLGYAANLAAIAIENRFAYEELVRRAYSDYLTGLANRRRFLEQAENELERSLRYGRKLSILMLDIDHFKQVNDTYGHKVGDLVLKKLSDLARSSVRNVDIIGRIGGEEFAVLLPETGSEQALDMAERLRAALAATQITLNEGLPLHFTVSLGIATLGSDQDTNIDILLNQADQALYQAKSDGRNRVRTYQPPLGTAATATTAYTPVIASNVGAR